MAWGYEKGFCIEHVDRNEHKITCKDCRYYDDSDRSCMKRPLFMPTDSQIYSVFDYLYGQYREKRWEYLRNHRRVSEYDSENIAYKMIQDILKDYPDYALTCFEPLSMVVRNVSKLDAEEMRYAYNPRTHLDFLIYNKMSKQPVLAIEVDGFKYHKAGTIQHE